MSRYVLAFDFGHGGGRVLFFDLDVGNHFSAYQEWNYFSPEDDELRKEFVPSEFYNIFCNLVRDLVKRHRIKPVDVVGISTASMRHSCVFLDKDGKEIYAGSNTDIRGLFYQDVIEEDVNLDIYRLTGQWPPLLFLPARLLWFKEEKPEVFKKIKYAVTTGGWLIYHLTGVMAAEPSSASATMLFDLKKRRWLTEILETLDMESVNLPEIYDAGEQIGELNCDAAQRMNLKEGIPVSIAGADSQLGLLACSAVDNGDIGVVAGTSTPIMMVSSKPIIDNERRIWTHCHVFPNRWVLESTAQMGGLTYQWLKNNFQSILGKNDDETYVYMEELGASVPAGSDDVIASLGSEILNINEFSIVRQGLFTFQQPVHPMNDTPATFAHFIRATLENISYAIRGNIEQLETISNMKSDLLKVTGGMSRSDLWLKILANVTGKNIIATTLEEGTSVGCAICAAVGAGVYKNLEEASKNMVRFKQEIKPEKKIVEVYDSCYNNWKELYDKLGEI